ncbi:MAG: flagellar hook-length control protein FliK [Proteobacteria bacterium]|nr:flagellar hook-length control protein FliK [Pseudomonadota bacterium]
MALSSANAVSPAPAVDNTAKANASVAAAGNGTGDTFTDSLDAVLAPQSGGDANTPAKNDNGVPGAYSGQGKLSEFKNRLLNGDAAIMLTPQQLQQQQTIIRKLGATNTGIDIPALRAAMGKSGQVPANDTTAGAFDAAANAAAMAQAAPNASATAAVSSGPGVQATPAPAEGISASNAATHAVTQDKLVAALLKTAEAPVLKDGQADGSQVPNAKIAHPTQAQKPTAPDSAPDTNTVQAMAASIAATAGATNSAGTAPAAAMSVAVAEVASKTAPVTPAVTKIETAAMANAAQTATHTPTPQAKIEAQALPVQFDAASANPKDKDAGSKSGNEDKNQTQAGSARTASTVPSQNNAPAPNFPDTQPAAPAPAHANSTPANANLAAVANTQTTPVMQPQIAATLQVSPQQPQDAPAPDQTAFAALGIAIAAKSKDGEKQFDINMHPADLGKIDVRISVNSDGQAQAHLTAEHPQTLQLLKQDQTGLAQNLRDAGLNLANNGLNFSLKGEQQPSTPTFNARSRALSISAVQTADVSPTSSNASLAPGDSRLDIRV